MEYFHYGREYDRLTPENIPLIRHVHRAELAKRTCPGSLSAEESLRRLQAVPSLL